MNMKELTRKASNESCAIAFPEPVLAKPHGTTISDAALTKRRFRERARWRERAGTFRGDEEDRHHEHLQCTLTGAKFFCILHGCAPGRTCLETVIGDELLADTGQQTSGRIQCATGDEVPMRSHIQV
mmetsp:Transcript_13996/g.29537  ORF Transcript_13996/g.29537 Transcript_13996/m.29537 type:complete len:127 (-) Transcript_13996:1127-1507(-)